MHVGGREARRGEGERARSAPRAPGTSPRDFVFAGRRGTEPMQERQVPSLCLQGPREGPVHRHTSTLQQRPLTRQVSKVK
jgi:hypothetical protein